MNDAGRRDRLAGLLTVAALPVAFAAANSPLGGLYRLVHHVPVSVRVGAFSIDRPLVAWINEGLMVFFFLLVGLEVKRQVVSGSLSEPRRLALPAVAALGGMLGPATIYLALNAGTVEAPGWAIPTATDIVLALAALSLVRAPVPEPLSVFLTSLAVFDDIGAILVIAVFYSEGLSATALVLVAAAIVSLTALNRFRVRQATPYALVGILLWAAVVESGMHGTLAGVVLALSLPSRDERGPGLHSPARRVEEHLRPWVLFGVIPLFTFFNAGIAVADLGGDGLWSRPALGIVLGLVVGKPAGILGATFLAVRLRVARLPRGTSWHQVLGIALLAGIGFTMSLFITSLALEDVATVSAARSAILVASFVSACAGILALNRGA